MADLRIADPRTTDDFVDMMKLAGVRLPLSVCSDDHATLVDASGEPVLVVDHNRERTDHAAAAIAVLVELAVNTCGGFKLEAER